MKRKILLFSIALITAGFLTSTAQNNFTGQDILKRQNINFEYPEFETSILPNIKRTESGQDWWVPDTVSFFYTSPGAVYRKIFKYNEQGLLKERIEQWQANNLWINRSSLTYTYDSNNILLTILTQIWENNSWVNKQLNTYTYDSNNNLLTILIHNWVNSSWGYYYTDTYNTYDSNNNLITIESNSILVTYTYDSNNNLLTELIKQRSNNSWVNIFLKTYTYDCNNNMLTMLWQMWNNNLFRNFGLYTYTYDSNNNILTNLRQMWSIANNSWGYSELSTYTYDSNNNLLIELLEGSGITFQQIMIYDENGNGISSEGWRWEEESWQPTDFNNYRIYLYYNNMKSVIEGDCYKMTASYIKVSDIETNVEPIYAPELNDISIYPNPTTGELRMENGELTIKDVHIFDIFGRKIINYQLSIVNSMDISHLPAGIYFVRITTEKGIVTKKVVKK